MTFYRSGSLIVACGIVIAVARCSSLNAGYQTLVGVVIGAVPGDVVGGVSEGGRCEERLLLRVARTSGSFRSGSYVVLQYNRPSHPCELPEQMFSGRTIWKFKLRRKATRQNALRDVLPIWDFGEPKTFETSYGRLTTVRFGNLTMLDGSRIEDLPLDSIVREFEFGAQDYKLLCGDDG